MCVVQMPRMRRSRLVQQGWRLCSEVARLPLAAAAHSAAGWVRERHERSMQGVRVGTTHVDLFPELAAQEEADVLQDGVAAGVRLHVAILLRHVLKGERAEIVYGQ